MNLFNRKILNQRIANYSFPKGEEAENIATVITNWQKALKDSDLSKTKEKSIQGKFLNVFFEQVLGYQDKTSGEEQWTLVAEPKTEVDAQTADGAIGFFTKEESKNTTVGVIELKDAKTSLDKKQKGRDKGYTPVEQGYLYATKFDRCKWIIVSNFREIRLYNKARSEEFVEKFDVLDLHKEDEFKRFYFLLNKENLIAESGDSPIDDLVKKSTDQEEDISKKFYSDYKDVRQLLFNHLAEHKKDIDKKVLFEKSQKILDRIVFILFCEDTANLLPKNILKETYEFGKRSRQRSDEKVWLEMKNLFMDIDEGRDDIDSKINGYNGGLFKFDDVLDTLTIKDDVWDKVIALSGYDFETDLNVNILGHIFEQSISDIENMKAEIEGEDQDKNKSKRKKDGIFYTPEYITKYIVENTVGKYLDENPDKLASIKILDPACGSGAFLNQAHSFLLNQYKVQFEQKMMEKQEKGEQQLALTDINLAEQNRSILLNNLFGVDLNDESVEITKLSLWLKTARKDEPLQNLDENIKVGNSLIDDPEVAGEKAFDWNREYKSIMKDGGFDVIIGNPPYVKIQNLELSEEEIDFYLSKYKSATNKYDLYVLFVERSLEVLNEGGYIGFIMPHKFTNSEFGVGLREIISQNQNLKEIVHFGSEMVFEDATAYTAIMIFQKKTNKVISYKEAKPDQASVMQSTSGDISYKNIDKNPWWLVTDEERELLSKLTSNSENLKEITTGINQGIVTMGDKIFMLEGEIKGDSFKGFSNELDQEVELEGKLMKPVLKGKDIKRFDDPKYRLFVIYPHTIVDGKTVPIEEEVLKSKYPKVYAYLENFKDELIIKKHKYKTNPDYWYSLHRSRDYEIFEGLKLMTPQLQNYPNFTLIKDTSMCDAGGYIMKLKEGDIKQYLNLLGILNSSVLWYFIKNTSNVFNNGYYYFKTKYLEPFHIPKQFADANFHTLVKEVIEKRRSLFETLDAGKQLIYSEYKIMPEEDDFEGWNIFIEKIERKNKLNLTKKSELQKWFRKESKTITNLKKEIVDIENRINQLVYELYDLTPKEINIIEGAV